MPEPEEAGLEVEESAEHDESGLGAGLVVLVVSAAVVVG